MGAEVKVRELPPCDYDAAHGPAVVDGRTRRGPWAYMCAGCWADHGVAALGTGFGQRLVLDVAAPPAGARPEGDPCGLCVHRRDAHRQTADPWELLGVACLVDGCPCARYVPPGWGPSAPTERPQTPSGPVVSVEAQAGVGGAQGPVSGPDSCCRRGHVVHNPTSNTCPACGGALFPIDGPPS